MTVAAAIAPEPNWDRFNTPTGLRYRDRLIERAGVRTSRVWDPQAEPMWSPTPIIGYRMWQMHPNGIVGATGYRWPTPSLSAVCRQRRSNPKPGAPHRRTDSACAGSAPDRPLGVDHDRRRRDQTGFRGPDLPGLPRLASDPARQHRPGSRDRREPIREDEQCD